MQMPLTTRILVALAALAAPIARAEMTASERQVAAQKIILGDAVLLDVREAGELEGGMAASAAWLAMSDVKAETRRSVEVLKVLPKDKPIYVYCAIGGRAERIASFLVEHGFEAHNFGGIDDVQRVGLATRTVRHVRAEPCPFLCPRGAAKGHRR